MALPNPYVQQGQAGPSRPAGSQKRKASAMASGNEQHAPRRQAGRARSQTVGQQEDIIELSDDEDLLMDEDGDRVRVRFEYGPKPRPKLRKSEVLPFVQQSGKEIFLRQAETVFEDKDEDRLKELAGLITINEKAVILCQYKKYWAQQLRKCVKAVQTEVDELASMTKRLRWEGQETLFTRHILNPKKLHLKQATIDAEKMAALIEFLQDN